MLQRQIMFKQLEELQRQKKLQELNDSRQQNVINKQPLVHNKQASGAQYAPLINGTPVCDPSQLFMFSNTNLLHGFQNEPPYPHTQSQLLQSMGLPSHPADGHRFSQFQEKEVVNCSQEFTSLDPLEQKFLYNTDDENLGGLGNMLEDNDNQQVFPAVQSGSWSALMQSALEETSSTDTGVQEEWSGLTFQNPELSNDNKPSILMENGKIPTFVQNARSFSSRPEASAQVQRFSPLQGFLPDNKASEVTTQRAPVNYLNLSQISQQGDTSHLGQLKEQDGQRSSLFESQQVSNSTRQSNVWVDIPSPFHKAPSGSPSTSDVANSRIEAASEVLKDSAGGHVLNSQGRGQEVKIPFEEESFSGHAEVNASSLNQTHSSPLNIRAAVKNEKVDYDITVPLLTSMPHLTSLSARESQLVKHSSYPLVEDASQLHRLSSFVQMNMASTSQYGSVWPVTGTTSLALYKDLPVPQSKKRKIPTYELLPWHKEATKGSSKLQDMSIAELEWAHATKRVPEKLKEEAEAVGGSSLMFHSKKRIILTTQLMKVLFRPAPAVVLSDDATACCNTIPYFAARLALGDACSLANHSHTKWDLSDSSLEKATISEGSGDENLSKIVESFIDRAKKLEDELLRLENGGSVVEIRMDLQDLERFSVINRFAKFHSRPQTAEAGVVPRLHPQRYVSALKMPKIVPQGHNCLSL